MYFTSRAAKRTFRPSLEWKPSRTRCSGRKRNSMSIRNACFQNKTPAIPGAVAQWSPTPRSRTGTGPWINWYRAAQKEWIIYIIPDLFIIWLWTMFYFGKNGSSRTHGYPWSSHSNAALLLSYCSILSQGGNNLRPAAATSYEMTGKSSKVL